MSKYTDTQGYTRVYDPHNLCSDKKGYIYEHRDRLAKRLRTEDPDHPALDAEGCLRTPFEVHHMDEDKANNEDINLRLKRESGHKSHHFVKNNPHPQTRDDDGRFI